MSAARIASLEDRVAALERGNEDLLALKARIQRVLHGELGLYDYRGTYQGEDSPDCAIVSVSSIQHWIDVLEGRA